MLCSDQCTGQEEESQELSPSNFDSGFEHQVLSLIFFLFFRFSFFVFLFPFMSPVVLVLVFSCVLCFCILPYSRQRCSNDPSFPDERGSVSEGRRHGTPLIPVQRLLYVALCADDYRCTGRETRIVISLPIDDHSLPQRGRRTDNIPSLPDERGTVSEVRRHCPSLVPVQRLLYVALCADDDRCTGRETRNVISSTLMTTP